MFAPLEAGGRLPNSLDLRSPDDFMAADLFAMHAAVKVKPGAAGEYSPQETADDRVNAFLIAAITGWSFPTLIPSRGGRGRGGRGDRQGDEGKGLGGAAESRPPLMDELEGEGLPEPKSGAGADSESVPVPEQQAG